MYYWRKLDAQKRSEVLAYRKLHRLPWHGPPHFEYEGEQVFIITASCYEHQPIIGVSDVRMLECESSLIGVCSRSNAHLHAWCVLPNHYHLLLQTERINDVLKDLGKFHGSSSFRWNGEDEMRGRKVWFRSPERSMRSSRHYFVSLNYIHNNPVKHGYVERWRDWPFSSAREYLEKVGEDEAGRVWKDYPVLEYGREWDSN